MRYALDALQHLTAPIDTVSAKLRASMDALPSMQQVRSLATWDEALLVKFDRSTDDLAEAGVDRSGAMAELSYLMAEHGWSDEQMFTGLEDVDSRWGKFVDRHNRQSILTDLVNRARQKVGYGYSGVDAAEIVRRIQGGGDHPTTKTAYRYGEFMSRKYETNWQIENLMPVSGIGLIVAPPGTGKTQFAFQLAGTLASGRQRFLHWPSRGGPRRALVLSLEMNEEGTWTFLQAQDGGYTPAERMLLHDNHVVIPLGEEMPLDQQAGQDWFDQQLTEYQPDMVVIDSLQRIASKEMTDELSIKNLMHYLSSARKKHKTSMVMVHHHRKKSTEAGKKHALELDDVYGSRYITADVDFVLGLTKQTDDILQVRTLKNRYARMDHDFNIIRNGNLMFDHEGAGAQTMAQASGLA